MDLKVTTIHEEDASIVYREAEEAKAALTKFPSKRVNILENLCNTVRNCYAPTYLCGGRKYGIFTVTINPVTFDVHLTSTK